MFEPIGAQSGQKSFAALAGDAPPRSRSIGTGQPRGPGQNVDTCRDCGQPVRRVYDDETAGWPVVVAQHPTDRATALAALVVGRGVVVHVRVKRGAYWRRLDRWTIGSANMAGADHHLDHVCGRDPPAPPTRQPRHTCPDNPPF